MQEPKYVRRLKKEGIYIKQKEGFVCGEYNKNENWAELSEIFIFKKYRHKGIGRSLIRKFERRVKELGITRIELFANRNTLAKFIGRMGYKQREDYTFFEKELK